MAYIKQNSKSVNGTVKYYNYSLVSTHFGIPKFSLKTTDKRIANRFKNKVNELKNVKPLPGGIAEKLEEINNWSDENNLINLNRRKSNNNRDYLNKISLTF